MKRTLLGMALLATVSLAACTDTPTTPDNPAAATMTYRQGARYQYESYQTDPATDARTDTSARRRTLTLVNTNATVYGRTGVAVYLDSLFSTAGGFINVTDSMLIQMQGTNDVYRYSSLITEANQFSFAAQVPFLSGLDLGRQWQQEARLNSTVGVWKGNELSDTVPNTFGIPAVSGFKIALIDSAVASAAETLTIAGTSQQTTRSTHNLRLSVSALVTVLGATTPIELTSTTIVRTVWVAPALGTIVKEHRQGKVVNVNYQGEGFTIPIPGYHSELTAILAAGA